MISLAVCSRLAAGCLFAVVAVSAPAARILEFDSGVNARFDSDGNANPSFLISPAQSRAIAVRSEGGPDDGLSPGVLITPRHFVAADHFRGSSIALQGSDGVTRTYAASASRQLTTTVEGDQVDSDVRVYRLDEAIDTDATGITPIAILDGDPSDLVGRTAIYYGNNDVAGQNIVDEIATVSFRGGSRPTVNIVSQFDRPGDTDPGPIVDGEVGLQGGDSGSPVVIGVGSQFALIGLNFGIGQENSETVNQSLPYNNFSSLLTPYLSQIDDYTSADGVTAARLSLLANAVPEPGSMVVLAITSAIAVGRRRKR